MVPCNGKKQAQRGQEGSRCWSLRFQVEHRGRRGAPQGGSTPPLPKARRLPVENEGTAAAAALLLLPPPLLLARSAAAGAVTATNAVAVEVTHPTAIAAATPFIVSSKCWMNPLTTLKNKKQKKKNVLGRKSLGISVG